MSRLLLFIVLAIFTSSGQAQSTVNGYWKGVVVRGNASMEVAVEFTPSITGIQARYDAPSQLASGIPLDKVTVVRNHVAFELMTEPVSRFDCTVSGETMRGTIVQKGFSNGEITLKRTSRPAKTFSSLDALVERGDHHIAVRAYFPRAPGAHPAVVFLHGSGDEGMFANQYLAEFLASNGIVSAIQDKQGVGRSSGDWRKASFEDLADDYSAVIDWLRSQKQVDKAHIGIYGHSQGGTIAPMVASRASHVAFVIAAAAIGEQIYRQDLYRVGNIVRSQKLTSDEESEAMRYYSSWLEIARSGRGAEKLDALNKSAAGKNWLDLVEAPPKDSWVWSYYARTGSYDPLPYWRSVKVPVLLIYGERDQIEDVPKYLKNIDHELIDVGKNPDVTQAVLPGAQHNLSVFPSSNEPFFWWHISPGYPAMIAAWIKFRFHRPD